MITLDTTDSIELVLAGAVAATPLDCTASWVDVQVSTQAIVAIGNSDGGVTGTGVFTLIGSPTTGRTRTVKYISVYNGDSTGATVTVRKNSNGTERVFVKPLLSPGDTLEYSAQD